MPRALARHPLKGRFAPARAGADVNLAIARRELLATHHATPARAIAAGRARRRRARRRAWRAELLASWRRRRARFAHRPL